MSDLFIYTVLSRWLQNKKLHFPEIQCKLPVEGTWGECAQMQDFYKIILMLNILINWNIKFVSKILAFLLLLLFFMVNTDLHVRLKL